MQKSSLVVEYFSLPWQSVFVGDVDLTGCQPLEQSLPSRPSLLQGSCTCWAPVLDEGQFPALIFSAVRVSMSHGRMYMEAS